MGSVGSTTGNSNSYSLEKVAQENSFSSAASYVDDVITGDGSTFGSMDYLKEVVRANYNIVNDTGSALVITDPNDTDKRQFSVAYTKQNGEEVKVTSVTEVKTKDNLGYNRTRLRNLENIRQAGENRRIVAAEKAGAKGGNRAWTPKVGDRIADVSYSRAQTQLFNAPVGTVISMDAHSSGDYVGEYTKTASGWKGSQQYQSGFRTPPTVSTADGFAMYISGRDIKVIKVGKKGK